MLRKCIGCGELKPAEDLIKITKDFKSGNIVINPDSKTFGRSAYLCYNQNCIDNALKKSKNFQKIVKKALRTNINIETQTIIDRLKLIPETDC